ncbi:alpha/beta hydrolase [Sulfitobacter maritimus]|uniref:alpha/beta fold hydrolase n=1 Tax=Sulfitobacter maritimus TaxID=2741719 RepID=UPI0031B57374
MVLLVGVTQWRARTQEAAAEARHPPEGQIIDVDGLAVHAKIIGSGPDLVLIHGASGNLRDFTMGFAERLSDRYRVILFDRPGMGYTARLPGKRGAWNPLGESPQEQAALLQQAADQLGVENPIVMGHSFGGAVALAWGLARPDQTAALVLVSAVSEPWPGGLGWLYNVTASRLGGALFIPAVTAFVPERVVDGSIEAIFAPQTPPEGYAEHIGAGLTLRRRSSRANAQQVHQLRPHVVEMATQYNRLTLPVEIIHGDADTIVPMHIHAEELVKDLPNGTLTRLHGMGHMPHHADPQAVVDAIDRAAARAGLR